MSTGCDNETPAPTGLPAHREAIQSGKARRAGEKFAGRIPYLPDSVSLESGELIGDLMPQIQTLVLYAKPGCCLCETLEAKLRILQPQLNFSLERRDITTDPDWFADFQYAIPVLELSGRTLDGISHRIAVEELAALLHGYFYR